MPFPKAMDYHKRGKPLVPNCYGIFYAIISVCYWYVLSFVGVMADNALALATSVLFGSTMGLLDDMINLRWRYKAFLPVFAALPYMVLMPSDRTTIEFLLIGVIDLGSLFFLLLVPILVTVVTNSYNQLGGLNGLESLPGLIVLVGLSIASNDISTIAICQMLIKCNSGFRTSRYGGFKKLTFIFNFDHQLYIFKVIPDKIIPVLDI